MPIIELCIEQLYNGTFTPSRINFLSDENPTKLMKLYESLFNCHSTAVTSLGAPAAELLMDALRDHRVGKPIIVEAHNSRTTRKRRGDNETLPTKQLRVIADHAIADQFDLDIDDFNLLDPDFAETKLGDGTVEGDGKLWEA